MARTSEKLQALTVWGSIQNVVWQNLTPDAKQNWLTEGMHVEYDAFLPLGTKEAKAAKGDAIFRLYSLGVATNRDAYAYDFQTKLLREKANIYIDIYNGAVDKYKRMGNKTPPENAIDFFDKRIKWTRQTIAALSRLKYSEFQETHLRNSLYRPFSRNMLFYDDFWNEEPRLFQYIFSVPESEHENSAICISGVGTERPTAVFVTHYIPDLNFFGPGTVPQWFPFYVYDKDGTNRRENITDWGLKQFQAAHGADVTKWDIFYYVYALLHSPAYRIKYAENLKRELPRIPVTPNETPDIFRSYVAIGEQLLKLHRDYEDAVEYRLQAIEDRTVVYNWRVEKMRLSKDKTQIVVNESLTLGGIPPEVFDYRLGNRSALEWVLDQYQVTTDKRSGIVSDPNREEDHDYIVRLIGKVITVSLETVRLVKQLV